jgi:predicted metal-dependent HD superfamily phosphohydrolase
MTFFARATKSYDGVVVEDESWKAVPWLMLFGFVRAAGPLEHAAGKITRWPSRPPRPLPSGKPGNVLTRWLALVPAASHEPAEAAGRDLLDRYAEPQRRYHDGRHLAEVLAAVDRLADDAARPDVVRLAAWFHDAVYDPEARPGVNEESSAQLAVEVLPGLMVPADRVDAVAALVRLTGTHDISELSQDGPDDDAALRRDGEVLCDADLAILGSAPERYAAYTADVRVEYAHVPDELFRSGRRAILGSFTDRARIYRTATAFAAWEQTARANLAAELAALTGSH